MINSSQESKQFKMDIGESTTIKSSTGTPSHRTSICITPDTEEHKNLEKINSTSGNCEYPESTEKISWCETCRVCANKTDHIIPIFEGEGAEHDLSNKIHKHLPIRVSRDDTLPLQLCYHCAATILAWHELLEGCVDAEKRLMRMESELGDKEQMRLKYVDIRSTNCHLEEVIAVSEELVDDPEPIAAHGEEEICMSEKVEELSEVVECTANPEGEERYSIAKKPFKIFLDTQNICQNSRKVKNEVRDSRRATRDNADAIWRDVVYTSIEHQLPNLESPIRADEDLDCSVEESSAKSEETELSSSLKPGNMDKEIIILCDEDTERISLNPVDQDSPLSDESNHDGGRAKCNICSREFARLKDLHLHARHHKDLPETRKIYECVECSKSFRLKDSFVRHLRIHRDERPFTCHVCGKQFRDSGGLSRHLKDVHAKLKNFSCDICAKSFSSKATRDDHRRTHTGERPYVCETCNKSFKSKACLYSHNKLHTNEFPHPCAYCNKKFRRRQEMLVHATTHTGEKNYSCDVCHKRFRVKTEVVRHKLTHSDEKPYVCSKCGLRFRQNRYLNNHIKTRHVPTTKD